MSDTSPTEYRRRIDAESNEARRHAQSGFGAVGTPTFAFFGDIDTGMWRQAINTLAFSAGGSETLRLTAGKLSFQNHTVTGTAPAAGGGGALPATPVGYITVNVNGTDRQIAYY